MIDEWWEANNVQGISRDVISRTAENFALKTGCPKPQDIAYRYVFKLDTPDYKSETNHSVLRKRLLYEITLEDKERKILRKMSGALKENLCADSNRSEFTNLCREPSIIWGIRKGRLRCL
jgi:hypothetical protein